MSGRGLLAHAARDIPSGWRDGPCVPLTAGLLADRDALRVTVDRLRSLRLARQRHVVLLDAAVAWSRVLRPTVERRPLWTLGADFRLLHDELAFLLADLIDARSGTPLWWPALRAQRLGCTPAPDGSGADVVLPDGRPARIDGGPRGPCCPDPCDCAPAVSPVVRIHRESVERVGRLDEDLHRPPREPLSAEQRAAVTHPSGPARVLAPAGSGKTRVLAARLRHLVHDRGVQPELITALAYNTRAAAELAERTGDVARDGVRPSIHTVHALGLAICTAALGRRPHVLDPHGTLTLLKAASEGRVGASGGPSADAMLAALGDVRLGLRDPSTVEAARGDVPGLTRILPRYRQLLHANGALDFDEQVHLAVALLLADPSLRRRVTVRTTHLLVDEAQDLTPAFVLFVRLLADGPQQVFAVGDDDQTIYGYAGATPRVLVDLPDAYSGAVSYTLSVNYRCPPAVVQAASDLLAHNTVRVPKTIRAVPSDAAADAAADTVPSLAVLTGTTADLLPSVRHLLQQHAPGSMIVLARVSAALLAPQLALTAAGLPVDEHVGADVLERTGLRTALAYLRIAANPERIARADVEDTLRRPARRLGGVLTLSGATVSLASIAGRIPSVDAEHRAALRRYVDDLALLVTLVEDGADSGQVVATVRDTIGLGLTLDALDRRHVRPEGSSHGDDLDALAELALLERDPRRLPDWLAEQLRAPSLPAGDGIALSTVHRVKGREWDVVALVGVRAGLLPHRLCDDHEEERRVLHVAMTRARRHLLLLTDPDRPSPFLPELLGTLQPARPLDPDDALFTALRGWRRDRAARDRVPAFLVAHDRTLRDVAQRRPANRTALRACFGIGPARLERYGDELLALVADRAPSSPPTT